MYFTRLLYMYFAKRFLYAVRNFSRVHYDYAASHGEIAVILEGLVGTLRLSGAI